MVNNVNHLKALCLCMLCVVGLLYSCKKSGATSGDTQAIAVTTTPVSSITTATATSGLTLSTVNGTFIADGICWDTNPQPTITLSTKVVNYNHVKTFATSITGLSGGITYYIRAFVTTNSGVSYGSQLSFNTAQASISIGSNYAGGIIFYIDSTKKHGLVASPGDLSISTPWENGNYKNLAGDFLTSTAIGSGSANTAYIISRLGPTGDYAALECKKLSLNGFNDWFLPSRDELVLMKQNLYNNNISNFTALGYWSSSTDVVTSYYAWKQNLNNDAYTLVSLDSDEGVRAARAF